MNVKIVRLGDVCEVVSGSTPKSNIPEYWDGHVKWITPAELNDDSFVIYDSVRHITDSLFGFIFINHSNLSLYNMIYYDVS